MIINECNIAVQSGTCFHLWDFVGFFSFFSPHDRMELLMDWVHSAWVSFVFLVSVSFF